MSYLANRLESQIAASLERCAGSVKQINRGRWDFALVNGKSLPMTAQVCDEWLLLDAPVSDRLVRQDLWRLLRLNGTLGSLCKFVLMPNRGSVHLRADVPLPDREDAVCDSEDLEATMAMRMSEVCSDLKSAFRSLGGEQTSTQTVPQVDSAVCERQGRELRQRFAEAGWQFIERSAGKLMVELNARGGFYQAIAQQRGLGAYVSVELASFDDLAGTGRQALSTLLLSAGGQARMARPAIDEQPDRITARFEVTFASNPTVTELTHALSALSVASEICGRETRAIQDETIARHYLTVRCTAADLAESREEAMLSAAN